MIREAIRARGPVTFAWFMERALYHPAQGYYSAGRAAIGRRGDYFTSVSVGPLFGRLLAAQFAEMWERLGRPGQFTLVEQGAHDGALARDVSTAMRNEHPDCFAALRHAIIEPFPILRERQAATLRALTDKVEWHTSLAELPVFRGVHFSNELIDAFPVHLVRWSAGQWRERYVIEDAGRGLGFVDGPLSDPKLARHVAEIPGPLPEGYTTEINLAGREWIETLAAKLEAGFILTADYGWPRAEYFAPHRTGGTLTSRAGHRVLDSPFSEIGAADLTAHVEWTSLAQRALASGCALAGFTDQHHFITGLLAERIQVGPTETRALQTLLHPQHLGMRFQFLGLTKNVETAPPLAGFHFARDSAAALGL